MKKLCLLMLLSFSLSATATCMSTCEDTDGGDDPDYPGELTYTVRCAAPGGPINTTVQNLPDRCVKNTLIEFVCGPAGEEIGYTSVIYDCESCDDGVCINPHL